MGLLLAMLLAFQGAPSAPPQQTSSLSGTVVDSISGTPVSRVSLNLLAASGDISRTSTTSTDANGKFAMAGLEPGQYHLRADRGGYMSMEYTARGSGKSGTVIRLEAGQDMKDLQFRLTPAGAIAGIVRDSDGDPIEGAQVELVRMVYDSRGKRQLRHAETSSTDDRGEYRFHGVDPGKYYIGAAEIPVRFYGAIDRSAGRGPEEIEVLTFYPGAPDVSTAIAVEAAAGKRVDGIDIRILKVHAVCVRGETTAHAGSRVSVNLEADLGISNDVNIRFRGTTTARDTNGDFQFCGVPSGSYTLAAFANGKSVQRSLDVGSADVNDLRLSPEAEAAVQIHVVSEGEEKADLSNFMVHFYRNGQEQFWIPQSATGAAPVNSGHYDVDVTGVPRGYYVKSIRSGDEDVLVDGLRVSGETTFPVDVALSPDGSSLTGVVLDKDQQPVPGATVLLAPAQRSRSDLFASVTTDQQGRYEFDALAPGSYSLFAFEDVEANAWDDPDFLRGYEKQGAKAELEAKGKAAVDLKIAVLADGQ